MGGMRFALAAALVIGCSSTSNGSARALSPNAPFGAATSASSPQAAPTAQVDATKPGYSCFSYVSTNSTQTRHACMRSDDCAPYLEQAKSVGGIRELSGCAAVPSVYCFHQVATADEPDGLEVCQPTLEECKVARADIVRAKMSVDSDCAQR